MAALGIAVILLEDLFYHNFFKRACVFLEIQLKKGLMQADG